MNAHDRLELINVKVERAKEHFRALKNEAQQYLDSKPYLIDVKRHPESRQLIYFVHSVQPTPPKLTAILGDVIHNLRSSLDHLAYQLVCVGTSAQPTSHVYFPIADSKAKYPEQRTRQMKGATQAAIASIDALAPYKGGNDILWKLHKLNNVDKHRVLLTTGSAFESMNIGAHISREMNKFLAESEIASRFSEPPALDCFISPADRKFPLKPGYELFIDGPDAEVNEKLQFRFEVAFGEQGVVFGESIIEAVSSMLKTVQTILPTFEPHLS